jgi:SNF2 family DNA or RNA helicase
MGKKYKLWAHQIEGIRRSLEQDTFALFFEVGTGKSATAIRSLCERMNLLRRNLRVLVFCPPVVCVNWKREFAKFSDIDQSKIQVLNGSGKERLEILKKRKAQIYVTNFEALLMKDLFEEMKKFAPEFIIFDEAHKLKSPQAARSKKAAELADLAKYKLILTGTPILQSTMDLFQEFRVLDGGQTFGKNFFTFRAKYFMDKNARMPAHIHFPDWVVKPTSMLAFNEIIHARGAVARKADCLDLPPLIRKRVEVAMGNKQARAYESMRKDFVAFMDGGTAVAQLAITKALRLQQIVSGFVRCESEGAGSENDVHFDDNPRIDALRSVLEEIFEQGQKVIIWAVFHENYAQIRKLLESMKVQYVQLHGDINGNKRQEYVDDFNNKSEVMALIGHPGSGGVGVNLIAASYSVYYSRGFSLEFDLQSEARNYRAGSERHEKITRIDLVAPNTIDDLILERLSNKQGISDKVLREIVEELKNVKDT